ncbi:RluA family pseudouridine synthase [Amycolatopsis endophytica]|uniref:RNA pseudouridylate synthase n=1 Tax=Amycolatopsis endophytica TaxID=860233 RepID=A0A853AX71_9PSEU|nr:pseudouridine synthase [Amycolatopsis endophytica]NYI87239.1 tRNA pseudouridine32 synthase/23S rRNA pseudouridine746 synthase [Amycolatopsis endophytica]
MRRKPPPSPLPPRDGVNAARIRTPPGGPWETIRDYLVRKLTKLPAETIDAMLAEGAVVGVDGPIDAATPFTPSTFLWFHRDRHDEVRVPFELTPLYEDDVLLVVDKPHFLATTPRGGHVRETALVRLRHTRDLPELSPAHRLDRLTAGVLMFVKTAAHRAAYQNLFRDRLVHKEYEAVAPYSAELELPRTVESRIVKKRGVLTARELPGPVNARTHVELLEHHDGLGRYRLVPETGRTHQLRVHLNSLGVPILNDPLYPEVRETAPDDFGDPLQLLAKVLAFTDPVTGREHRFESGLRLRSVHIGS